MATHRDSTSRVDDSQLRIVSHRLQVTAAAPRPADVRARKGNGSAAHDQERPAPKTAQLRQIVLVDRDVDALREVAVALRDQFDFHVTISGNEALTLLQSGTIDAIVVGQTLYSSTGLNVLAEARRRAPHTQRVLLANAVEATGIDRDSTPALPFRVLWRPCTPQKLLELLDSLDEPAEEGSTSAPVSEKPEPVRAAPSTPTKAPTLTSTVSRPAPTAPPRASTPPSQPSSHPSDYEHVVLETPPELPRRRARHAASTQLNPDTLPIVVYTDNVEFYQSVCRALQERHDVRLATQLERAVEMAEMGACPILITDRAGTQMELQRISIAIRASEPALVTIASGSQSEGLALRKLINTPALHSFLAKPLSMPLVRLAIESAKRQYVQSKAPPSLDEESQRHEPLHIGHAVANAATSARASAAYQPMQSFEQNFDIEDRFDFRKLIPYAGMAALAIAVIGTGAWYWQYRKEANAEISVLVDAELNLAQRAYNAGDYVMPENANALYFYRRVLKRDPAHAEALRGIEDIAERLVEQTEKQLTDDQIDAAAASIALLKDLRPDHKRLAFLESQVNKANGYRQSQRLAAQSAEVARVEAAKASATQARLQEGRINENAAASPAPISGLISNATQRSQAVSGWLTTARQRLTQGRLVAPEADSAEYYLRLAERADPNNTAVDQGLREIGTRLLSDARDALSKQQIDAARRRLAEAGRFGPDSNAIARIQSEIDSAANANVRGNFLRLALQRTRENSLFEPAQDSAKYYLSQLQRLDANSSEVQQATRAISLKLIDNANQATAQRQYNIAVRLLDEARRFGYSGQELSEAESRLQSARNPPPPAKLETVASAPKVMKSVAPRFPEDAAAAGVSGWVDVGFKINAAGDVYDAVAMASNPPGVFAPKFERAAVAAISQYKFERRPILETQEQTMVVRVQFKLP